MKLTLREETTDRSLERRWDLAGAEPVPSHPLPPAAAFIPVDLRLWWQKSDRGRRGNSFRGHAWPAKGQGQDRVFASWSDTAWGPYESSMPQWVRDLADTVRIDLEANLASAHHGQDLWGYGSKRRWTLDDAPLVSDRGIEFIPVELDIWHSFYPDPATRPDREHRYSVYARSDRRRRIDYMSVQWGGTASRHDPDMPGWVRELVDAQYADLAATGRASTAEREGSAPCADCGATGRVAAYPFVSVHDSWIQCPACAGSGRIPGGQGPVG